MSSKKTVKTKSSNEPQTMEELLKEYGSSVFSLSAGDKVKGKIVSIEPNKVLVDIGTKGEGLIAEKAYQEAETLIKTLHVGDEIEAKVLVPETNDGFTILSMRDAVQKLIWQKIQKYQDDETPIRVKGKSFNLSGVTVELFGNVFGFIPISQLGKITAKNPNSLVGKTFEAKIIDFNESGKKVILSEKEVSEKEEIEKAKKAVKKVKEGEIFDGVVTSVFDFGCFVKFEVKEKSENIPLEGLVHISELSWQKIDSTGKFISPGDKVSVKVISKYGGKLALSIKKVQEDPWEKVQEKYKKDSKVKGEVVKTSNFGAFVSLEPGIEGLVHITKIPPGKKFGKGDKVDVYIEDIDKEKRKISLGLVLTEKPVGYK